MQPLATRRPPERSPSKQGGISTTFERSFFYLHFILPAVDFTTGMLILKLLLRDFEIQIGIWQT